MIFFFLPHVHVDGKHLRQIKKIDIQQILPIEKTIWSVAHEEIGQPESRFGQTQYHSS